MTPAARAPRARGRRPGSPDTRAAILAAARSGFAEQGYKATTMRAVATAAGVDAALVHHYFGTKDELFLAAMELPVDPRRLLAPVMAGPTEDAAERFLEVFVSAWDDPAVQPALLAVARGVMDPEGARLLSEGFLPVVVRPVVEALGVDRPDERMPLVASQMVGLILLRYVLRVEPLASMAPERVVATYAPTIQRYLSAPLP